MQADDLSTTYYVLRWLRTLLRIVFINQLEIYTCWMAYSRTVFNNRTLRKKGSTKCYKDNQRSMESNGSQYLRRDKGLGRLLTASHSISLPRAVFHCSLLFRFEFYCLSVSLTSVLTSVRELPQWFMLSIFMKYIPD